MNAYALDHGYRKGHTAYERSPANIRKRVDKRVAAKSKLPPRRCWHCGKSFVPDSPFIRYCGSTCRHLHLNDYKDDGRGHYPRHSRTNAGDGDGSAR